MRLVTGMTAFEDGIIDEIVLFDNANAQRREILCCVTSDGSTEIDRAEGTINRVELPSSLDAVLAAGQGVRLFHNHPSQGSLSETDWRQSIRWKGKADLVAINGQRTIFAGAAKDVSALDALLTRIGLERIRDSGEDALFLADCPAEAHRIKPIATHLVSHLLNMQLHALDLVFYDFHLSDYDKVIWDACSNLKIWEPVAAKMRKQL